MSGRVTSSGNMPPVCSNRVRRRCVLGDAEALGDAGQVPHRIDRDLDHRDAAIVVHVGAVGRRAARPGSHRASRRGRAAPGSPRWSGGCRRPRRSRVLKVSATRWPHGSSETMRPGSDHCGNGPMVAAGWVLVRSGRRIGSSAPDGDRERAVERIGAAMGADDVAVVEPRHGADHRAALARRRRAPVDRERALPPGSGWEVRRIWSVRLDVMFGSF